MAENPRQDLFLDISQNLLDEQLQDLCNYISGAKILPAKFVQKADAHQIFNQLENEQKLKLGDLSLLAKILRKIGRHDYAEQVEELAENERKDSSSEQSDSACKRRRLDTTETKETQEQANALRSAVSTLYKNTLNMLKPLPWDPRFSLDLDAVFTSLELVSLHGLQDRGNLASLDGVFDHQKKNDQDKRFNVLVVGDAGGGKSTLLSKTALDWSCGKGRLAEMNKIVLLVRLREVQPGESIARIIWDQCVTQSEDISVSSIETCLRENEPKLVFQLDGYDELVPGACESKETIPKLLAKKLYPRSTVIVTSRPFTGVEQYMKVNCEMKVMGFSPRNVEKYVTTYFNTVEKPGLADSLVKALQANIIARSLIQTPMFLMLICVLWEDDPTRVFPGTMSGLYQELLACVVRKFCVREDLPMPNDEFPSMVSTALLRLGKLALESFLRGESLVDLGNTPTILDTDILLKLGIVSKEVSASRLHPREQLNFPHKTMQEFLAGRYVADTVKTSSGHLHELVPLDSQDKLQRQSNLVQFICGCGGKATREMLAQFNKLHVCEAVSESEPESEPDNADNTSLKDLCMMSLYEGQDPRYFPIVSTLLSSLDLTINVPSKQGAALKYCLNHAPAVPEGRSLKLAVKEASKGDAVEYLSCLVEKHMPDVQLYFELFLRHCYIGNKLCKLIPLLQNVPHVQTLNLRKTGLTPESLQSLGGILPKLVKLERLDLSGNENIGDTDMRVPSEEFKINLTFLNLRKSGLGDLFVKSLAAVLHNLHRLVDIDLSDNKIGLAGLEPFSVIQHPVASLKKVSLYDNKIGDVCMRSLASVLHHLSCLEDLNLSYNNIGSEGMEPFAAIEQPVASLKVLNLCKNKIGDVCMRSLASVLHHLSCVEDLNLSYNNIGNEGLEPFAAIQQPVANLKVLDLSNNKIGDVCMRSLASVLHHLSCVEDLNLSYNNIGNEGLEPFAAIQQPVANLKVLDLSNNKIGDVCMRSLASVLHHLPCVEDLNLSYNNIGNEGLELFAAIQQPIPSLKELNLSHNKIGDVCMRYLASLLHHLPCLVDLNLSYNNIGSEGMEPFTAIQQPVASLKVLNLCINKIGDVCMRSLAAVLHHLSCLEDLDLSQNNIGDAELASIVASLHHVPCLKYLTLSGNSITEIGIKDFAQTIPMMPALKYLNLKPCKTVHLDDTGSTSIVTMLTRLPGLECLNLMNISMQAAGFMDMVKAAAEQEVEFLDFRLYYSEHLIPLEDTCAWELEPYNLVFCDEHPGDEDDEYSYDEMSSDSDDDFLGW
ncbi:nucleotide-binding oligomerization domain-containing protein 2-like isoform X2 [Branchiostoma floridae]|uniref:Nucleotide-binding oligomerization domain-containing protein 2-like isoform X2 n=1 Tax=Branchiostoma floridae TaxID=7739 RepID=A0A9J7LKL3_BRAFL|nr:nucleotide-binding oligomerization domain-containing protein 2-like isoform X2 [Branchiostoma floridae]